MIVTGSGFDVVHARSGNDLVCTGRGGDRLYGESGDDRLNGGRDGKPPTRTRSRPTCSTADVATTASTVGPGLSANRPGFGDRAVYKDSPNPVQLSLTFDYAETGPDTDRLASIEDATGSLHADVLTGDVRPNDLDGLAGRDRLFGGDALDRLHGDAGDDHLLSGDQYDIVLAGTGDDVVRSGTGPDEVYGETGRDRMFGEAGNDRLYGEDGRDMADGGQHARFDYCRAEVVVNCER